MSAIQTRRLSVQYQWSMQMIPWYRQVLSLIYGLGVMLISLWALEQGTGGSWMILGVVGMSFMTLMLIFGVEISEITVMDRVRIDFTDTGQPSEHTEPEESVDD